MHSLSLLGSPNPSNMQDLGNTNYSVMIPRETFDRNTNAELVASALSSPEIGISALVNERHDIVVQGKKICY